MPELPAMDLRLPDLHLPEIDRDQIVRSLSEIHLPEVDLPSIERPKIELPDIDVSKIDWPKIDLSSIDIGKAIAGAAAMAHIRRRPAARRRRWRLAVGALIVAGLAGWAVLSNPSARERADRAIRGLRERIDARRGSADSLEVDTDEPVAFTAAETAPIQPAPYADVDGGAETPYPDGLGVSHDDGDTASEESGSPA